MKKNKYKKIEGFSLIELLVAFAIFSLVSLSLTSVISTNIKSSAKIKNNLIAATLAQEGLEIVRNLRDNDWFNNLPFGSFGNNSGTTTPNGLYLVQWNSQNLLPFSDQFLKKDENGIYNYTNGQNTIFKRVIKIEDSQNNPPTVEKVIKVMVSWQEEGGIKTIQSELHLFNWF